MVSPARRRAAVEYLVRKHGISERRACILIGQHRSTQRYKALVPLEEAALVRAMNTIAARHPRWGYRAVWTLLRQQGWKVNRKRIERLWRLEGHRLPHRGFGAFSCLYVRTQCEAWHGGADHEGDQH